MPEGPSIVILKEAADPFTGKKIIAVSGNSKMDSGRLKDQTVIAFKSWGKHFLICFDLIILFLEHYFVESDTQKKLPRTFLSSWFTDSIVYCLSVLQSKNSKMQRSGSETKAQFVQ